MRLGVLTRGAEPFSVGGYRDRVLEQLPALGVDAVPVPERGPLPDSGLDLLWDPGLGMRRAPAFLRRGQVPLVVTVHGLRACALPLRELARTVAGRIALWRTRQGVLRDWEWLRHRVRGVVAVSEYGAREIQGALGLGPPLVRAVHHGVDHGVFRPQGERLGPDAPFFLCVAQDQPKKNLDRLFRAWASLDPATRPGLVAIAPGYPTDREVPLGVDVRREPLSPAELACWYRGALAFLMPSLHETFGMPILEAMACGCPVLTSDVTACPEVVGDAALCVDPRSTDALRAGLVRLATDDALRGWLRTRGLRRAERFTWEASARAHRAVFEAALEGVPA